jgi:hypothetical protein
MNEALIQNKYQPPLLHPPQKKRTGEEEEEEEENKNGPNTEILHPACDIRTQTSSTPPNKQ